MQCYAPPLRTLSELIASAEHVAALADVAQGEDRVFIGPTLARATRFSTYKAIGQLSVSWENFEDYGSGIKGYAVTICLQQSEACWEEDPNDQTNVWPGLTYVDAYGHKGETTIELVPLLHNQMYYATVRPFDRLGNIGNCYSDGVLFDITPPNMTDAYIFSHLAFNGTGTIFGIAYEFPLEGAFPNVQRVRDRIHMSVGQVPCLCPHDSHLLVIDCDAPPHHLSCPSGPHLTLRASLRRLSTQKVAFAKSMLQYASASRMTPWPKLLGCATS